MKKDVTRPMDHTRLTRRSFLKKGAGLAISLSAVSALPLVGCGQQAAPAASPSASSTPSSAPPSASASSAAAPAATSTPDAKAYLAQLYEAAKKEGEVLWYTPHNIPDAEALNSDFNQRYPGVKAQFWRAVSEQILEKVQTESRAGRNAADLFSVDTSGFTELKDAGLIKKYKPLTYDDFSPEFRDPDGYWVANFLITIAPAYNTNLVKGADIPKTWEDLLDPKWKGGKLCLEATDQNWTAGMLQFMGKEKGLDYLKKLADQKPQLRTSHITQIDLLAAGEFPIVVASYNYYVEQLKAKGAPLEWVRINPTVTTSVNFGINNKAPHPNAAMLLWEYLSSVDAHKLMTSRGRFPGMFEKVEPNPPSLLEPKKYFLLIKPGRDEQIVAEAEKIFRDLFQPKAS